MKRVYRNLVVRRPFDKVYKTPKGRRQLQPLAEEDAAQLALLQARWRQLVNDIVAQCRNGDAVDARCVKEGLKNVGEKPYVNFAKRLARLGWVPEKVKKRWKAPIYLEADIGRNKHEVYVDLDRGKVAVRIPTLPYTYVVKLGEKDVEWIRKRLEEGAEFANMALVWIDHKRRTLNIALLFRREPPKLQPRQLLVVDVNALYNGVAYAVVEEGLVVKTGRFVVPSKAIHLAKRAIPQLQRACAKGKRHACRDARRLQSKFYKILREFQIQTVKRLIGIALRKQAAVVVDAPEWDSLKKLKEEGNLGVRKQFLNVGRLLKRLKHLAEWYGIPYAEERLYSKVCPNCGAKLYELNGRRMRCPQCGFEEERDRIPLYWAQKRYREIMAKVATQATTTVTSPQEAPSFSLLFTAVVA